MKNALIAMTLAVLPFVLVGCDTSDNPPAKDAGAMPDTAGVAKDATGEDASKRDSAPTPTVDAVDSPNDVGVDTVVPSSSDAVTFETKGEAKPDAALDAALDAGSDGPKNVGLDGAPDPGIDGAKPVGLDGAPDIGTTAVDGGNQAKVVLRSGGAYGNCMPSVSPDPIIATWTVEISGAHGTTAQLAKATVTVTGKTTIVQELTVDNPTIALVNGAGSADQRKPLSQQQPNSACESMCSGGTTYRLDLVYSIDGQSVPVSKSGSFSCAY
jgi:hypothetical protein